MIYFELAAVAKEAAVYLQAFPNRSADVAEPDIPGLSGGAGAKLNLGSQLDRGYASDLVWDSAGVDSGCNAAAGREARHGG